MAADFEIEIDLGGGVVVPFTISEEAVLSDPNPAISGFARAAADASDPAERRKGIRSAAYERVVRIVSKNLNEPVSVVDGDTVWVIPIGAIRALRMRDPEVAGEQRPFGFVNRPGE
jgi:endonuclease YncB( thermonuclease family)